MNAEQQGSSGSSEQDGNSSDRNNSEGNDPPRSSNDSSTDRMEIDASAEHSQQARETSSLNDGDRVIVATFSNFVSLHERLGRTRSRAFYVEIGINPRTILLNINFPMHDNAPTASDDQPLDLSFLGQRNGQLLNRLLRSNKNPFKRVCDGKNKHNHNSLKKQLKRTVCQRRNHAVGQRSNSDVGQQSNSDVGQQSNSDVGQQRNPAVGQLRNPAVVTRRNRTCYHRRERTRRIPSSTITSSSQQAQASGFESFCTTADFNFVEERIRWMFLNHTSPQTSVENIIEHPESQQNNMNRLSVDEDEDTVQPLDLSTNSRATRRCETQQSSRTCYFSNQQEHGDRTGAAYVPISSDQQSLREVSPPSDSEPIVQGAVPGAVPGNHPTTRPSSLRAFARSITGSNSIGEDGSCWHRFYNYVRRSVRQPIASGSRAGTSRIAESSAENRDRIQGENCENMQEEHGENPCYDTTCNICRLFRRYSELRTPECTLL